MHPIADLDTLLSAWFRGVPHATNLMDYCARLANRCDRLAWVMICATQGAIHHEFRPRDPFRLYAFVDLLPSSDPLMQNSSVLSGRCRPAFIGSQTRTLLVGTPGRVYSTQVRTPGVRLDDCRLDDTLLELQHCEVSFLDATIEAFHQQSDKPAVAPNFGVLLNVFVAASALAYVASLARQQGWISRVSSQIDKAQGQLARSLIFPPESLQALLCAQEGCRRADEIFVIADRYINEPVAFNRWHRDRSALNIDHTTHKEHSPMDGSNGAERPDLPPGLNTSRRSVATWVYTNDLPNSVPTLRSSAPL